MKGEWYFHVKIENMEELEELSQGNEDSDAVHPLSDVSSLEEMQARFAEWQQAYPGYKLHLLSKSAHFGYGAAEYRWMLCGVPAEL